MRLLELKPTTDKGEMKKPSGFFMLLSSEKRLKLKAYYSRFCSSFNGDLSDKIPCPYSLVIRSLERDNHARASRHLIEARTIDHAS